MSLLAPNPTKVALCLEEMGLPYELVPVDTRKGEQHTPEFLAINPEGKVPTLLIDTRPLTEVAGILFYLARKYPEARLLPEDPEAQAHAVAWMSFIASTLHPARRQGLAHATETYRLADQKLGPNQWALGEYSIVDIHLFRLFWRFAASIALPPGTLPNLEAHHARMLARPAVQRTIEIERAIGYELPA